MRETYHVNYRAEPELFANIAIVDASIIDSVGKILSPDESTDAKSLLALAILAEAAVFNEQLVVSYGAVHLETFDEPDPRPGSLFEPYEDLMKMLVNNNIVDAGDADDITAARILNSECEHLTHPSHEAPIEVIHGSHIFYEIESEYLGENDNHSRPLEYDNERPVHIYTKDYIDLLRKFGEFEWVGESAEIHAPLNLLANCHGIPYISDVFYTSRNVNVDCPTNIGVELYRLLESLHKSYFSDIRKFLGPTYLQIPPILSLVLQSCKRPEDVVTAIVEQRERFSDFRKECTKLDRELRVAVSMKEQIEIIHGIENAYQSLAKRVKEPKSRILIRVFDVVQEITPIAMAKGFLRQAKQYQVERDALLKMPGYYDLWEASTAVEQAAPLIQRLFGNKLGISLLAEFEKLYQTWSESRS